MVFLEGFRQRLRAASHDARGWEAYVAALPAEARAWESALGTSPAGAAVPVVPSNAPALPDLGSTLEHRGYLGSHAVALALTTRPWRALASTYFAEDADTSRLAARTEEVVKRCVAADPVPRGTPFEPPSAAFPSFTHVSTSTRYPATYPEGSEPEPELPQITRLYGRLSASASGEHGVVAYGTDTGVVAVYDGGSDEPRFTRWFGSKVRAMAIEPSDGIVVVGLENSMELALDSSGEVLWVYGAGAHLPLTIFADPARVLLVHADGRIVSLAAATGEELSRSDLHDEPLVASDAHSVFLLGKDRGAMVLLDRASGSVRFERTLRDALASANRGTSFVTSLSPVFRGSHVLVAITYPPVLAAIDRRTGDARIVFEPSSAPLESPSVDGDRVLLATRDQYVELRE